MTKLFLAVLNMSLTGAFVIAAICLARLLLKKAPKIISYCLWTVVGFRLLFPFSIESIFSLVPFKAQTIPPDIVMQPIPQIDSSISFVNNAVNNVLPAATPAASVNPLQIWASVGAFVWLIGVAIMLIYGIASFVDLKRKMQKAVWVTANIYEEQNVKSPFVFGIFAPNIYLPIGLSLQEREYIILHEQTHIRRLDHIVKFTAYFILCLHWFNPFAWAAFLLMGVDMEMSCDERVIKEMGGEIKRDYSLLLLSLATNRRIISGSPLAFGEGGIKQRIKNVLNFKKPSRVIIIAAVVLVAILSIGLAVSKIVKEPLIETGMVNNDTTEYSNTDNLNNVSLAWPYLGEGISSRFGPRGNGFHSGIDIAGPTGDVVVAAETGEVIFAELYEGEEAYGNLIIIEHPNGMQTWYAHVSTFAVSKEQKVEKGQIIGEVGATGQATGPHLHFEVRVNDEPLNPLLYLSPIE